MKTKERKVEELVERVAGWLCKRDNKGRDCWVVESKDNQNIYKREAKRILSYPDLALIIDPSGCSLQELADDMGAKARIVIPLAEALKGEY